ncbi:hypothetical protein LR48_Vigan07g008800 [Vigna angularis]|uniref:Uncharacterized protein n=1 Tax=Phaseolus angularis TaxID=3914 RepID=A0A0L9UV18_PHAAN|nr:hypothetical protein LR48_Vigan07g008800 [Vigna angularis]
MAIIFTMPDLGCLAFRSFDFDLGFEHTHTITVAGMQNLGLPQFCMSRQAPAG